VSGHLRFISGGALTTVQDEGRVGWQRHGISASGAIDRRSMHLANALVGNPLAEAVLEITLAGPEFVVEADAVRLALTGADFPLSINDRPAAAWRAHALRRGDRVRIGTARAGMRGYLAVAGGLIVAPVLGSRSTHTRSSIGGFRGRRLEAGDEIPIGDDQDAAAPLLCCPQPPDFGGPVRVVLGPQADAFTEEAVATLLGAAFTVSVRADRMGAELDGPALAHRDGFNIISDGIVNGSIQVPGHGRPVVLLADRQSTGGYPKIATVVSADLGRIGQRRPGDEVRFSAVSPEEAIAIARAAADEERALIAALAPAADHAAPTTERLLAANLISGVVSGRDTSGEP